MQELFRPADFVNLQVKNDALAAPMRETLRNLQDFQISRVAGLAVGEGFAIESKISTPLSQKLSLPEFQDALGEWMAIGTSVSEAGSEFVVLGDSSGYCPVFYAQFQNNVVVADTFIGAVHGLKRLGANPELDVAHYVAALFPAHPHFDNPSVRRTMSSSIRILGIEEALLIQSNGLSIINRSELSPSDEYSYEELLERGSQLVRSSIRQLSAVDGLQKVLSLSGGVDSRLVLSLISSSGYTNEFELNSVDPRTWKNKNTREIVEKDVAIADRLRTDRGLEWTTVGEREFLQFDFRDSLNFHQSYKSNFAHSFSAPPGHTVQSDLKITFRGGGGELLRTTLTGERIAEQIRNRSWKHSENLGFTDWYMSRFPMLKHEQPLVQDYMAETFNSVSGESLKEKLNELYRHTRNRTHFGHVRQSGSTNNYAFHPLSNQYFIQASKMLGFEERSNGKIVRDLYNLNDPSLLDLPFENEESTRAIANPAAQSVQISSSAWRKPMDRLKSVRSSSTARDGWTRDERLIKAPYDKIESSRAFIAQSMKLIEDFVDPELKKTIRRINARAFEQTQTYASRTLPLSTKISSALDVFAPSQPSGDCVQLFTTAPDTDFQSTISKVQIDFPVRVQDGWHNQNLPEFTPELSIVDDAAIVSIGLAQENQITVEFAVYLYKNNRRIDKSWYGKDTKISFEVEGPGIYFAQVFYRSNSAHRTSLGIKTNEVLID
ncbi:hypothetical protein [Corynebacterium casei]|uniref:Asparagine synthetase domain-containing protein n=1 Tax=Corynebacterium casei UCMA 3821 TaxID=1110505 RepID=G7HXH3_9CORY|nr:hypothetical protein [Corynebacterium casei]CCE54888.1 putative uncharacterized protein [Corynebacterium casei UCMA 3821]